MLMQRRPAQAIGASIGLNLKIKDECLCRSLNKKYSQLWLPAYKIFLDFDILPFVFFDTVVDMSVAKVDEPYSHWNVIGHYYY